MIMSSESYVSYASIRISYCPDLFLLLYDGMLLKSGHLIRTSQSRADELSQRLSLRKIRFLLDWCSTEACVVEMPASHNLWCLSWITNSIFTSILLNSFTTLFNHNDSDSNQSLAHTLIQCRTTCFSFISPLHYSNYAWADTSHDSTT